MCGESTSHNSGLFWLGVSTEGASGRKIGPNRASSSAIVFSKLAIESLSLLLSRSIFGNCTGSADPIDDRFIVQESAKQIVPALIVLEIALLVVYDVPTPPPQVIVHGE